MWFSLVSQLPPRCDLLVISHLCPLALNLEPSLLLVCEAGLMNCPSKMLKEHLPNVHLGEKKMFDIHSDQHVQVILLKQVDQRPDDVANC